MSEVRFIRISRDYSNLHQSWTLKSVYRYLYGGEEGQVRVEIRSNAIVYQSHAKISRWSGGEWKFHSDVPADDWYDAMPSYVQKQDRWGDDHYSAFDALELRLLRRFSAALLKNDKFVITVDQQIH